MPDAPPPNPLFELLCAVQLEILTPARASEAWQAWDADGGVALLQTLENRGWNDADQRSRIAALAMDGAGEDSQTLRWDRPSAEDAPTLMADSVDGVEPPVTVERDLLHRLPRRRGEQYEVGDLLGTGGQAKVLLAVVYSPDGATLASASSGGDVLLWNVRADGTVGAHPVAAIKGKKAGALNYARGGSWLACADAWGGVTIRHPRTGHELHRFDAHDGEVFDMDLSPDGSLLATVGADEMLRLWRLSQDGQAEELLLSHRAHAERIYGVAFSPDGTELVTVGRDKSTRRWRLEPAATWVNGPAWSSVSPSLSSPQHQAAPVSSRPQVCRKPAVSTVKSPAGGSHWPASKSGSSHPQQRTEPSSSMTQEWAWLTAIRPLGSSQSPISMQPNPGSPAHTNNNPRSLMRTMVTSSCLIDVYHSCGEVTLRTVRPA